MKLLHSYRKSIHRLAIISHTYQNGAVGTLLGTGKGVHPSVVAMAVAVVATVIAFLAGKGGRNGGASSSVAPRRLTILRVPAWSPSAYELVDH